MRRTPLILASAAVLAVVACTDTQQPTAPADPSAAPIQPAFGVAQQAERVMAGRVLARLAEGADAATVGRAYGLEVERERPGYVMFRGAAAGNERALAARMGGDAQVVWAEPDYLRQTTADDDGTGIDPRMWAFYNPGGLSVRFTRGGSKGSIVSSYLSVADADEDALQGIGSGGSPVSIASIDTGVDAGHEQFAGGATIAMAEDFFSGDSDPSDTDGHGTHTTGTMVGNTVGVAGVTGASSNVTVYVYRVCGPIGCPTSAIVDAIYAATDAGVVAMNLSLGGGSLAQSEANAIAYATANDALVIASAGNGSTSTVSCPACDPNAISVAASDWLDQHAYYTNWGNGLDITAPGGELYSNTTSEAGIYSSVPGGYAYYQGTSMAAPQVTGTAAVVASVTGLTGAALRSRLEGTTDDLGAAGYDTQFGHGRLNTHRAVTNTTAGGGTGDPNDPGDPPAGPTASFTYSCNELVCSFDGSASTGATTWHWTASDGWNVTANDPEASHAFAGAGNFTVTLEVGDGSGNTDSTSQTVQCKQRGRNGIVCN